MKTIDQVLLEASENGDLEAVQRHLKGGSDVNGVAKNGRTALHYAAVNGHESIARALVQAGADVNARCNVDWTALHLASLSKHESIVRLLLQSGACIDERNDFGRTALHYAAWHKNKATIQFLIQAGAEWTPEDREEIEKNMDNPGGILSLIDAEIAARELRKLADLDSPPCSDETETNSKPMRL